MGVALSALVIATACGGGDAADSTHADSGAVQSASGDVAGSNMNSPAMVMGFLSTVNRGEIEAGQLASTKATNAQVKQYGQMLVTDHRRADTTMHGAMTGGAGTAGAGGTVAGSGTGAAGAGGTVAGSGGTGTGGTSGSAAAASGGQPAADLQQKQQQMKATLDSLPKGRAWDSTFVALMVQGHQDVLTRLEGMRGGSSASGSAGTTGGTAGTTPAGTANPGAVGSTGTTQSAGQLNQGGDQTQTHLQSSIEMVRRHLERGQELQRTLQGATR